MKILVLASHPDDEVLGVGGTILRHRDAGDEVRIAVAYTCRMTPPGDVKWWRQQQGSDPLARCESIVAEYEPHVVYTHHRGDINADHRILHDAVMVACRPYAAPFVRSVRTFYTPSSTEWGEPFHPTLYVDITATIDRKLDLMVRHYIAEMRPGPHPRSVGALRDTAGHFGSQAGYRYAEAFQVVRDRW